MCDVRICGSSMLFTNENFGIGHSRWRMEHHSYIYGGDQNDAQSFQPAFFFNEWLLLFFFFFWIFVVVLFIKHSNYSFDGTGGGGRTHRAHQMQPFQFNFKIN